MGDLLERLAIVLVNPQTPENVGSIARAMANFGLGRLVIAGSPGIAREPGAYRLAVHSESVLEAVEELPDFEAVRREFGFVMGTTAHDHYETWHLLEPGEAIGLARGSGGPIALVFGSERYGLSKADLRRCDQVVHLPTARPGQSLNLAQAVLLFVWEFWRAETGVARPPSATAETSAVALQPEDLPDAGSDWLHVLEASRFLKPHNREKKLATLRQVLSRVRLSSTERAALQGLGSKLALLVGERTGRRGNGGSPDP